MAKQLHSVSTEPVYRGADDVMRLARMGSAHPTRLSFLRIMLRRMQQQNWRYERMCFDLDAQGVGHAVYTLHGPDRSYSLVAFAHDLPDDMRSDRVIATAWDATFALFDGVPSGDDINRLSQNVPLQEAGRVSAEELTLSRANRSVRLFDHVVTALAQGRQPDAHELDQVGYLMRTTAVYGSGKFGAQDRSEIANRPELSQPFQAEMMTVWLIRQFTVDVVNHLARQRGGASAVEFAPDLARGLGVGNSTGLGMAPFLVKHPGLLHAWASVREEALTRVRGVEHVSAQQRDHLCQALRDAIHNAEHWSSESPYMAEKLPQLRRDLAAVSAYLDTWPTAQSARPWDDLWRWASDHLSSEGQEAVLSLMLEPHGDLIDGLADCLSFPETVAPAIQGAQTVQQLRDFIADTYDWALAYDFKSQSGTARFWYVSEEKLEPRLGSRHTEDGSDRENPLGIAWQVSQLWDQLCDMPASLSIAEVLLSHPQHRQIVRRIQSLRGCDYGEIRENLLADDILPIDMMRYKLAYFGASRFDPRSDKWVRISLFAGLPYPTDIGNFDARL